MKKKEVELPLSLLAEKGVWGQMLEDFKKQCPNGSAPISEVLSNLQKPASTSYKYVGLAIWIIKNFPPTQEPLVLNEPTRKVIFWNGDVTINCDIDGKYLVVVNGKLKIKGKVKLIDNTRIWAKIVKAKILELYYTSVVIEAKKEVKAINIVLYDFAEIWARGKVEAPNIATNDLSGIYDKVN
ncbi:hypothetical protein [Snodgrassella alvi]|uniref:Uncharacterized protein n=1 Tax=Snodgrassella alvi TaxID=1196083 RepID=A0A2N9X6C2_9NEIS|nr:hypothetical protein [Snodgrassella alvi]PIT38725.1 hypothetical protein BHC54_09455 [Snodgrassella alvi]